MDHLALNLSAMEETYRSPLEQLESEAIYLIRETAALFEQAALLVAPGDPRSQVLTSLADQAFEPAPNPLQQTSHSTGGKFDALLSADTGGNFEVWPLFGKHPKGEESWSVFPLASWSDGDIASFQGGSGQAEDTRLLRLCTVGEAESGKSALVEGLSAHSCHKEGAKSGSLHRHLTTRQRRLFIIDPPGQEPYSHGLMAAASACEIALLVVDATQGLTTTSKRQAFLLALMGVPHLVVVINKMDLVDYSRDIYEKIVSDFEAMSSMVEVKNLSFVPVAALTSENLVSQSEHMPWHVGTPLLDHLDAITPGSLKNLIDLRLPVQGVYRDGDLYLGGRLASGRLSVGDRIVVLPSGTETEVATLSRGRRNDTSVYAGDSVTVSLASDVEVGPGDIVVSPQSLPNRSSEIEAVLLWLGDDDQKGEKTYVLHHGTRLVNAHVSRVLACLEPETLTWAEGSPLARGDIGRVQLTTAAPLYFDSYTANREMGAFALLDAETREVLGAGVLRGPSLDLPDVTANAERLTSDHVVIDPTLVKHERRREQYGHEAAVLWFTGLSGSGKSAVAKVVEKRLFERGCRTLFLDGDNVRTGLNGDLGFTEEARTESTRRVAEMAALVFDQGQIVVCSFISGKVTDRAFVRSLIPEGHFFECYVNCPIDVCRSRDPKKLYEKADAGELLSFSGISIPYEEPENPHLELRSDREEAEVLADRVMEMLEQHGIVGQP